MIVILCGPPACGKTTIASKLEERLSQQGVSIETLHSDDIDRDTYDTLYETVEDSETETNWILDGTFYSTEIRDRFRTLEDVHIVWVDADRDTCVERDENRADSIDKPAIYVMHSKFEAPEDEADITVDTEAQSVSESVDTVEEAVSTWLDE